MQRASDSKAYFVCYAREDEFEIRPILAEWRRSGRAVFQDIQSIQPGEEWEQRIADAIDQAQEVHVFWSTAAAASMEVRKEIGAALASASRRGTDACVVVPELLDSTPLPPELAALNGVDRRRPGVVPVAAWVGLGLAAIWTAEFREKASVFGLWSWMVALGCLLVTYGWLEPWLRPIVSRPLFTLARLVEARDAVVTWRAAEAIRVLWPVSVALPRQGREVRWWVRPGTLAVFYGWFAIGRLGWTTWGYSAGSDVRVVAWTVGACTLAAIVWAITLLAPAWIAETILALRLEQSLERSGGYAALVAAEAPPTSRPGPPGAVEPPPRAEGAPAPKEPGIDHAPAAWQWAALSGVVLVVIAIPLVCAAAWFGDPWLAGVGQYASFWIRGETAGSRAGTGWWSQSILLAQVYLLSTLPLALGLLTRFVFPGQWGGRASPVPVELTSPDWVVDAEAHVRRFLANALDRVAGEPLEYLAPGYALAVLGMGVVGVTTRVGDWVAKPELMPVPGADECVTRTELTWGEWTWTITRSQGLAGRVLADRSLIVVADAPVQSVSWCDAARFANVLSCVRGLTPAYTIGGAAAVCPPAGRVGSDALLLRSCEQDDVDAVPGASGFRLPGAAQVPARGPASDLSLAVHAVTGEPSIWLEAKVKPSGETGLAAWARDEGSLVLPPTTTEWRAWQSRGGGAVEAGAAPRAARSASRGFFLVRAATGTDTECPLPVVGPACSAEEDVWAIGPVESVPEAPPAAREAAAAPERAAAAAEAPIPAL